MRLGNMQLPCGCDARKEIMFTHGNLGITEATIVTAAILAISSAYIYSKKR